MTRRPPRQGRWDIRGSHSAALLTTLECRRAAASRPPAHRATTEFKKFLTTIDKTVPAELDVYLICDNYGTHKTPAIRAQFARHPQFHMHFTPTGSLWINQVERWFGYLTEQKIRRGAHKSVQSLEADIRAWISDWNSNPRLFVWTRSAEETLDSLADFVGEFPAQNTRSPPSAVTCGALLSEHR